VLALVSGLVLVLALVLVLGLGLAPHRPLLMTIPTLQLEKQPTKLYLSLFPPIDFENSSLSQCPIIHYISHLPILRYRATGASLHPIITRLAPVYHLAQSYHSCLSLNTNRHTNIAGNIAYEQLLIILPLYYGLSSPVQRVVEDFRGQFRRAQQHFWTSSQTL